MNNIKIDEKVVGTLYVNIQLPLKTFKGKSISEIMDRIKGVNGHDPAILEISIGKFRISSFRRMYDDDEKLCIEGAELEAIKEEAAE